MPARKQITKDMILDAALTILKQDGMQAINIKALAKTLNCSTQPVYLAFKGMDELRAELIPLAVKEFEETITAQSTDRCVWLYGMEYVLFAKNEPNLFCFLFMRSNAFSEMKRILLPMIERSITELMQTCHISHKQADLLHDHLWMHTHGIASMIATNFCDWDLQKVNRMLTECQNAFMQKYEV